MCNIYLCDFNQMSCPNMLRVRMGLKYTNSDDKYTRHWREVKVTFTTSFFYYISCHRYKFNHVSAFHFPLLLSPRHDRKGLLQELPDGGLHPPPVPSHLPANQLPPQGQALPPAARHPRAAGHHNQRLPDPQAQDLQDKHPPSDL